MNTNTQNNIAEIAMRIRDLREICGYSPESMAKFIGLPLSEYKQYESGKADIPISVLCEISAKCGVAVTALITGADPKLRVYSFTKDGCGVDVARQKEYQYEGLGHNFYDKKVQPFVVRVQPSADHTPVSLNTHPGQEFDYLLEGELLLVVNNKEFHMYPGDSIYFDPAFPHGMKAVGNTPAKFLAVVIG